LLTAALKEHHAGNYTLLSEKGTSCIQIRELSPSQGLVSHL